MSGNKKPIIINSIDQLDLNGIYSYADYITWKFDERVELIKGKIFKMSPAPNSYHQKISKNLTILFDNYLKKRKCEIYYAPFDVRLPSPKLKNGKILNVVQPDICIICNPKIIDPIGCNGVPNLIIEILSPSTERKDQKDKFELYEQNEVQEYWIVNPANKSVIVYTLNEKKKFVALSRPQFSSDKIKVSIFNDLEVDLTEVFGEDDAD